MKGSVRGVGFSGDGPYVSSHTGPNSKEYRLWSNMMTRCYYEKYHDRFNTYVECDVSKEWHNFQEFAEWCNFQTGFTKGFVLDKDFIGRERKLYSPETCIFVPSEINSLIVARKKRGKGLPQGVAWQNSSQKYIATCSVDGKNKNLGRYSSPEEAFSVYKVFKENLLREKAEFYKDELDERAYFAIVNYKI